MLKEAYIDLKNITYQIELKTQTKLLTLTKGVY